MTLMIMWMPLVLRKTTNNPQSRFSAPVTQEWRQDWHRILLVAHSCYRSLSRRSPVPLCHLTEPPVASNSCALSLFLEGGVRWRVIAQSPHMDTALYSGLLGLGAVQCTATPHCTAPRRPQEVAYWLLNIASAFQPSTQCNLNTI